MSTMVPQPRTGWHTTSQDPTTDFTTVPGQAVDGIRVGFVTDSGVTDSVFVPNARYGDLDWITAQIAAKASQHAAVAQLRG